MQFPKGVSLEDVEGNISVVVLLRKALHDLCQSPQLFNKLLNELPTSCGFQRCDQEACIYKYYGADGWILIGCKVDDLIVTGTNEKKIAELQKVFKDKWSVDQWGDIHTFLGMRCQYNRSEGGFKLDVEQNIKDMLKRFPGLAKLPNKTVPLQPPQVNKELKLGNIKVVARCFRLSSLRRRHARQQAAGRARRRAEWGVWYFDHAGSAGALGFARFPPLTSVNCPGWCFRRRADRARKKGADHCPSARRWPGYVRRGTGGASNCTNGPKYGPAT